MNLYKSIIGVAVAIVVIMGTLVPYISAATFYDTDNSTITFEEYSSSSVDGWTLAANVDGSQLKVSSRFWNGSVNQSTYILVSDAGSIWYDGTIKTMFGNTLTQYFSLELSITDGKLNVGSTQYPVSSVYIPAEKGNFGSHYDGSANNPVASIGTFAGITLGTNGNMVFGDSKGYVFGQSTIVGDDRKSIEIHAGIVDIPDVDPFLFDIETENEPEPEPVVPGEYASSGTTGSCTWELDGDVLYIRGNGAMGDYTWTGSGGYAPWPTTIREVIIERGVTKIGAGAFGGPNAASAYTKLVHVSIPSTVTTINNSAFRYAGITTIDLPSSLKTIYDNVFRNTSLRELIIPDSVTYIGSNVIAGCTALRHLYVPDAPHILAQNNFHFIRLDGYDLGGTPVGDLYLGSKQYVMYQTKTVEIDGATYRINYIGAELESSVDTEVVYIPYTVEYDNKNYTIESIAHGAISGLTTRYVIIPQTIESISHAAFTAPNLQQVLNLSETEVISEHGDVRTSIPSEITLSRNIGEYNPYTDYLTMIPVIVILSLIVSAVGFMWNRRL